jgi:hypothetical protein
MIAQERRLFKFGLSLLTPYSLFLYSVFGARRVDAPFLSYPLLPVQTTIAMQGGAQGEINILSKLSILRERSKKHTRPTSFT